MALRSLLSPVGISRRLAFHCTSRQIRRIIPLSRNNYVPHNTWAISIMNALTYSSITRKPCAVVAMGNPLLDMTVILEDNSLALKYGLPIDGQTEITPEQQPIFEEVLQNYSVQYMAGGSAQNTLRVFQWLVQGQYSTVFMGGIGKDKVGRILEEIVQKDGVLVRYAYHEVLPTGSCVALVCGDNRSLAASLGAANVFELHHLQTNENLHILQEAQIVYIEGFFITHSAAAAVSAMKYAFQHGKLCALNLSGVFVCEDHFETLQALLPYVHLLFGNNKEFSALLGHLSPDSQSNVAQTVANYRPPTSSPALLWGHKRIAVMTQGHKPILCSAADQKSPILEFPVERLSADQVKDTTGAGDAFVAGFLAKLVSQGSLESCFKCGDLAAKAIIKEIGCTIPSQTPDFMSN